jgi:sugar phosphate isomerase/epimerase
MTAERLLDKAAEREVRVVQFADNLPLDRLSGPERSALRRCAEALQLDIELGTRGIVPEHLIDYLRLAQEFGSPLVRIVTDTDEYHPSPDDVVVALRGVMPAFERAGVTLAIENHDRFRGAILAEILNRVDSPRVGICLDTANSIGCLENLESLLSAVGDRVVNVHLKDYQIARLPHLKGFMVEGRPAGRGQLDIPWLLAELRTRARDPNAIVELWPPPEPSIAESVAKEENWATESIHYLRQWITE